MSRQFRHIPSPNKLVATLEIPIKWQRVNSCAFCGVKNIVHLVNSMTLYKTESLRLHSNSDISSKFQVNIMPKKPWPNIRSCTKTSNLCRHASFVWRTYQFWSWSFYSSESSQWHITADMRDTRHTFPTVDWFLILYAIHCNQIQTIFLADLENTGYHRQSYLRYTDNLIRLEDGAKLLSPTPPRRHSTPNSSSACSNQTIFAPDGIFCEKMEKKCGDR